MPIPPDIIPPSGEPIQEPVGNPLSDWELEVTRRNLEESHKPEEVATWMNILSDISPSAARMLITRFFDINLGQESDKENK